MGIFQEPGTINVVYDCDDVLLNLNDTVFGVLGFKLPSKYNIYEEPNLDEVQKQMVLKAWSEPAFFMNAKFAEGAEHIREIEKTGKACVWISSACFNEDIKAVKLKRLPEHTGVDMAHIDLQIVSDCGYGKRLLDIADILIEDCREHLLRAKPGTIKLLIDKTYNQADPEEDLTYRIVRHDSLLDAMYSVERIVNSWGQKWVEDLRYAR